MRICGQHFTSAILRQIQSAVAEKPDISRRQLSTKVCEWLDWKDTSGRCWQEMGARKALARLHREGHIQLPDVAQSVTRSATPLEKVPLVSIEGDLDTLGEITLTQAAPPAQLRLYRQIMAHHPQGDKPLCGAQLRYLIRCSAGHMGAAAFQSGTFALKDRDRLIGWPETVRRANLKQIVANARFLILPSVRVPNLASHLLGHLARRLPDDWEACYGIRPVLLETFIHPDHDGASYRAANWIAAGHTAGRRDGIVKQILLYPLCPDWKNRLWRTNALTPSDPPEVPENWAEEEFGAIRLWDTRLKRRLYRLAGDFLDTPNARGLTERAANRAETVAAYRFFDNPRISMTLILAAHREAVIRRMQDHPVILAPQDTTFLNYSAHPLTQGLGPIGTKADGPIGLVLHNTHAFTPEGVPLGVLDADCWARDPADHGKRRDEPERESQKWISAFNTLSDIQKRCPQTMLVSVGDRESDFYALLREAQDPAGARLLVRAERGRHRRVEAGEGEIASLWAVMEACPLGGRMGLHLPRRGSRAARDAQLEVRFQQVTLHPPKCVTGEALSLWAVHLLEKEPPQGRDALEWMLLTTVPTQTFKDAVTRAQWYAARWGIEVFHRTLKTGCQIENRDLGTSNRLEICLAIDMVVAWRITYLSQLARSQPDAPCTAFFEDVEWKALYVWHHETFQLPPVPPSMQEATRWLAIKGGFQGRKSDGHPGAEVLWRGLQKLNGAVAVFRLVVRLLPPQVWCEYPPEYFGRESTGQSP